jgi:exopolyphosphatase/guanosine-5'-triphosphate,3'-diphosphate pyrophosphatase
MLGVRHIDGSVQTMAKIKRKVRLTAGLNKENELSAEAMQRGWDCLSLFAERLQDIPPENIRIVGTATLRTTTNVDVFLKRANEILGYDIDVISGEEAATIYKGVAHTSGGLGKRLVVDIGGASTELIIGEGFDAKALTSLKMGCVTWLEQHFKDRQLTASNFSTAIEAAKNTLSPILEQYKDIGWDVCVGASGTVQALQEIMLAQGMDEVMIAHAKLKRLQKQAMLADHLEELDIDGLTLERALVFPSDLSILIAIFELLEIDSMTLAGGALREGMVYEMMAEMRQKDIRDRTITSLQSRYQLDSEYSELVAESTSQLLGQCGGEAWIAEPQAQYLLTTVAKPH